jgi:hypothetical protein
MPHDKPDKPAYTHLEKCLLTLTINYEYWTNHQDGAEGYAREAITCFLYEELLSKVTALRVAIVSDDHEQALSIIEQIEQYLKGK